MLARTTTPGIRANAVNRLGRASKGWLAVFAAVFAASTAGAAAMTMAQATDFPYATQLAAAERGDVIAWVTNVGGARNIWVARGPAFVPLQVTRNTADDGQEITQLTFSPDGTRLVYVRVGIMMQTGRRKGTSRPTRLHRRSSRRWVCGPCP